jgi:hypothetical protein
MRDMVRKPGYAKATPRREYTEVSMAKKEKKDAAVQVEGVGKNLLDGGVVSTNVSKEMREALGSLASRLERPVSWVQRDAFKAYLKNFGQAV